jgi:molybdate transport system ATP-binding protein
LPNSAHRVKLRHRAGPLELDVEFSLDAPWTALFAPSGAGKTTILRMIAGLDHPENGWVVRSHPNSDEQVALLDTTNGISLEPHNRNIRMVAQRPALFPHRSVVENIEYGMPQSLPEDEDELLGPGLRLDEIISLCRIAHLLNKIPAQLSGGERQRVALARSLAASPMQLLLLDEPFTGLEADLRDQLIADLRIWLDRRGIPVLLVTHDIGEVFAANAHVLKMESGRIVASGPAAEVLATERNRLIQRLSSLTNPTKCHPE